MVLVCGGDGSNYEMFYIGACYPDNDVDNIAAYAKDKYPALKDKSLEEIKDYHIYWGSEMGSGLKSFYNGDTYVLFEDIDKLPEDMKHDAKFMCDGYRKELDRKRAQLSEKYIFINAVSNKCWKKVKNKYGGEFYSVGVSVPEDISESGFVNITCNEKNVLHREKCINLMFDKEVEKNVSLVRDSKRITEKMKMSDLVEYHNQTFLRAHRTSTKQVSQKGNALWRTQKQKAVNKAKTVSNRSAMDKMASHNHGKEDKRTYENDPEWQELNDRLKQEIEVPPDGLDL